MRSFLTTMSTWRILILALLAAALFMLVRPAFAGQPQRAPVAAQFWAPPQASAARLAQTDPRIIEVLPIQTLADEPLVIGKSTVVRVRLGAQASRKAPLQVHVALSFDGKQQAQDVTLVNNNTLVDFFVAAPAGQPHDIPIQAEITLPQGTADGDTTNNKIALAWPTVLMPKSTLKVFYLPVDWTDEIKQECDFDTYFDDFVAEDTAFARATYPLPDDQVVSDSTKVPHMLSEDERQVVNSDLVYNEANTMSLFASVILTGKTYAPDAELIAAVMPPRWIEEHANPRAAGFASAGVRGATIVLLGGVNGAGTVIAHEFGHIRQLTDDYAVDRAGYPVDRPGYWVTRKLSITSGRSDSPYSFMGSSGSAGFDAWIDSRTYDHLLAKYVSEGGAVSQPMVLAATLSPTLDASGAPNYASAGARIYDPFEPVTLTVAHTGLEPGTTLHVRWLRGGEVVAEDDQTVESGDFGYTPFTLDPGDAGHALGDYSFELTEGDQVVKSGAFSVAASWLPDMSLQLGDNKSDGSAGYRGGIGVSPVLKVQPSVFVPSLASDAAAVYGWFVAQSDGSSAPRDFDVDLRFFDPSGKQYAGEWVDDGAVTAAGRISDASIARKMLRIAGTAAAQALGTWKLAAYVGGKQVGSTTFVLAARGAASDFDRVRDAARAANLNFVDGSFYDEAQSGAQGGLAILSYRMAEPQNPYSPASMQEVWSAFNVLHQQFPQAGTLLVQGAWSERYSLVYLVAGQGWSTSARKTPSLASLDNASGFHRLALDLMEHNYLSGADATKFYTDRFGK